MKFIYQPTTHACAQTGEGDKKGIAFKEIELAIS